MNQFGKKTGLAAALEEHKREQSALTTTETKPKIEFVKPEQAPEKIRIIFDDSYSMEGQSIKDAHEGCEEFLRNCIPNQVAIAVHPMNREPIELETNLPLLATKIKEISAIGSTPLFATLNYAFTEGTTRFIVFSDGASEDRELLEQCISVARTLKAPVDTVYIDNSGREDTKEVKPNSPEATMKYLAEATGGIYLKFVRGKVNFKQAFKYLAPELRLQLVASVDMQRDLQEGKLK